MPEARETTSFTGRLRKLPGQFLLALVNATALLVIAAGIIAIIAMNTINDAAARLAGSVSSAVAAEFDFEPKQLLGTIEELEADVRSFKLLPDEGRSQQAYSQLEEKLDALTQAVAKLDDTLEGASAKLTDDAIRTAADSVGDNLVRLRGCDPGNS